MEHGPTMHGAWDMDLLVLYVPVDSWLALPLFCTWQTYSRLMSAFGAITRTASGNMAALLWTGVQATFGL